MMDGGGMFFGGGYMWIFWVLIIVALVMVIKATIGGGVQGPGTEQESPLEILKKRYARGEIDEEEYKRRRRQLEA